MKRAMTIAPQFLESAAALPKTVHASLLRTLWLLSTNERHPGLQTRKIRGVKNDIFECRVDRNVRLLYDLCDSGLRCWYVGQHDFTLDRAARRVDNMAEIAVDEVQITEVADGIRHVARYCLTGEVAPGMAEIGLEEFEASVRRLAPDS